MLGWLSEAKSLASRSSRASRSGSSANAGGRTLIATSRSSVVSTARQTSPIPPSPIFSTRRKWTRVRPGSSGTAADSSGRGNAKCLTGGRRPPTLRDSVSDGRAFRRPKRGGETKMIVRGHRVHLVVAIALALVTSVSAADKPPAGKPAWSAETKSDLGRLGIGAGAKVVYARDDKKLVGLSTADGSVKYQRDLPGFDGAGYWGQLDDTTYVYSTSKEVIGIDLETGKDRWHASPGEGIKANTWQAPTAGNPKALLLAYSKGVSVWDINQGKVLWSAAEPLDEDMSPCIWADAKSTDTGVLMFLPKRTVFVGPSGKELWSAPEPGNKRRGGEDVRLDAVNSYGRLLIVYTSKQVVLLNNVTGEVIASQTFPSAEAAADVEAFVLGSRAAGAPLLMTLGGRVIVADPKEGKLLGRTPENSILGQMAGGVPHGDGEYAVLTIVRGKDKTPNVGLHLYRVNVAAGEAKWHAYDGATIDTSQVMQNVVGEKVNGPYFLEKANGILLASEGKGVRLYNWDDGKQRWSLDENLPNSFTVKMYWGSNSFSILRSMVQNKIYVSTNPPPVEGDGVVYVGSEDEVLAIDTAGGQLKWK